MTATELRPATAGDEHFIHDLMIETLAEELAAWAWPEPMRAQLLEMQYRGRVTGVRSKRPDAAEQIIVFNGEPVGRMVVASNSAEIWLLDIAVLPERRNEGIGTAALGELLAQGMATGRPVRLNVNHTNRAGQLYQRLGFLRVGGNEVQYHMEWVPTGG